MPDTASETIPADQLPLLCVGCGRALACYDGDMCGPCYWAAIDNELSCDWLPDDVESEA
jgi:hypothetical protein